MKIVIFSFVCAYYIFTDLIPIYNAKQRKIFWSYLAMISIAYCINLLVSMDVKIPSPAMLIRKAVTAIFKL
ncbi:MAG TPA: hypothetical protein PK733_12590 [Clostridiales bacterium]|nr:hypothetical protein [Clostridiales bacterium]